MQPYFDSFGDFIAMGGHGFYVWLCYLIVSVALIALFVYNRRATSRAKAELTLYYRRQQRIQANPEGRQAAANLSQPTTPELDS